MGNQNGSRKTSPNLHGGGTSSTRVANRKCSYAGPASVKSQAKRLVDREQLLKSQSLHDLDVNGSLQKYRRQSMVAESSTAVNGAIVTPVSGSIRKHSVANSRATTPAKEPIYADTHEDRYINGFGSSIAASSSSHHRTVSGSYASNVPRQKSVKKSEAVGHPISMNGRDIIQYCLENAPQDFGSRVLNRVYEKRSDFQKFVQQMGRDKWFEMTRNFRDFLFKVVVKIDNLEVIEKIAQKYGEDFISLKCYGFKPDFWVTLADLLTTEAVMLDQATHQHSETVTAWSLFVTMLFSSIRDGYYNALREQRNSIRKKSLRQTNSNANQTRRVSEEVTTSASSTTPSPTGATLSSNNLMMEKIATARRDSRTSVNQLNVSNSRKSSVGSNAGGDSQRQSRERLMDGRC